MRNYLLAAILTVVSLTATFAQKEVQRANALYDKAAFADAIPVFEKVLSANPELFDAQRKLAEAYRLTGNYKGAEKWYSKVVTNSNSSSTDRFHYGQMLKNNGKYDEAKKWLNILEKEKNDDERIQHHLSAINSIDRFFKDSISFQVESFAGNQPGNDFSPTFFKDGLVFTASQRAKTKNQTHSWTGQSYTRLYFAQAKDGAATIFAPEIKTALNNGPATIFGNELITTLNVQQVKDKKRGYFRLKLVRYVNDGKKWKKAEDLPFNKDYSFAHPAFSKDGQRLYFASDMPGGEGGMDLYFVERNGSAWGQPVSVGKLVNTPGNEMFPYVAADGALYFASDGHEGLGGLDIFSTRFEQGAWTQPNTLSYPINTSSDDFGLIITPDNSQGFFASNRPGGKGGDDIYSFTFTQSSVAVDVKSALGDLLDNAVIQVLDKQTGQPVVLTKNVFIAQPCHDYEITVSHAMYRDKKAQNYQSSCVTAGKQTTEVLMPAGHLTVGVTHKYLGGKIDNAQIRILDSGSNNVVAEGPAADIKAVVLPGKEYQIAATAPSIPEVKTTYRASNVVEEQHTDIQMGLPPEDPNLILGVVYEQGSRKPLDSAAVIAYDAANKVLASFSSASDGGFAIAGFKNISRLVVFRNGYFSQVKVLANEPNRKSIEVELPKLELDKVIQLDGIFYDLGKFAIRPDAARVLDNLVKVMVENPSLNIELSAHTDARGKDESNLSLSDKRAKAAAAYVISKGISEARIVGKGYGETQLKNRCGNNVKCSESEHQQNRRTEVKVTSY